MRKNIVQAQLSHEEKRKKLQNSLEDHRHLIGSAIEAMSEGDLRQALTLATSVRALVHETGASKPLLKSLRPNYLDLAIMAEPRPPIHGISPVGTPSITFSVPISVSFASDEPRIRLNPDIDPHKKSQPCSLGTWWTKPFMHLPAVGEYSRKQLILDVANKEAAHVDVDISEQYKRLLDSQFLQFKSNGDDQSVVLNISRLLVGRIGIELLAFLQQEFPAPP